MRAVMEKINSEITEKQRKELLTKIESNIPFEQMFENQTELPSIQFVPLTDGIIPTMKDDIYYIEFEKEFLKSVSEELTTFD